MKKIFFLLLPAFLILYINTYAQSPTARQSGLMPSVAELKKIINAGGSIILDLDKQSYTVSQLRDLASSLKFQSTLTIIMGNKPLSTTQCSQIASSRPGQVIFWF